MVAYAMVAALKQMPWFYNWLYWLALAWFICSAFYLVGAQVVTADSEIVAKFAAIALSIGPVYSLWLWRRLRTGSWI